MKSLHYEENNAFTAHNATAAAEDIRAKIFSEDGRPQDLVKSWSHEFRV